MIKEIKALAVPGADFLVEKVMKYSATVWASDSWEGEARLVDIDGEKVIVLSGDSKLLAVFPIDDLLRHHNAKDGQFSEEDLERLVPLMEKGAERLGLSVADPAKMQAAKKTKQVSKGIPRKKIARTPSFVTPSEVALIRATTDKVRMRTRIKAEVAPGKFLDGFPVVEGEWELLRSGTPCVLVKSHNEETGEHGDKLMFFEVGRWGSSTAWKKNVVTVLKKSDVFSKVLPWRRPAKG
jgi:hypothetical protein